MKSGSRKALVLVVLIGVCVAAVLIFDVQKYLAALVEWIEGLGWLGRLVFAGIYAVATVLFVPGSILTLGAGILFGLLGGVAVVLVGATLGALGAFITGRYFMSDWINSWITRFPKFQTVYDAISREGGKIIFFLRLSPLFPFNASNYLYSLTSVKTWPYIAGTFFGILPGTVMYVYFGTLIGNVAQMITSDAPDAGAGNSNLRLILLILGLVATVFVTIYATRVAKKALKKSIESS